jgi:hypothetical protein
LDEQGIEDPSNIIPQRGTGRSPVSRRFAQTTPPAAADTATVFNAEQFDALLAPTAFYPNALPAQVLMAANPASWTLHALSD